MAGYLADRERIDSTLTRCLAAGRYILGEQVAEFEKEFASAAGSSWAIGVANGTDAVEFALRAVGIGPGSTVITVSHTAVATVAAIARTGARPEFVDIDPDRYTMSPNALLHALRAEREGPIAVLVVHLYGQPADIQALSAIAHDAGMPLVEDCAQAHGAFVDDRNIGSFGSAAAYSFYPTKNLGAFGDGGAVTGNDTAVRERILALREYGWRERYVSQTVGFNSRLDELQAAILRVRLPNLDGMNRRRVEIADAYDSGFDALPTLSIPKRYPGARHVFHQYVVRSPDRDRLRADLEREGIGTLIHYPVPVHLQPAFACGVSLPETERLAGEILSLPMFPELMDHDVKRVVEAVRRVTSHEGRT